MSMREHNQRVMGTSAHAFPTLVKARSHSPTAAASSLASLHMRRSNSVQSWVEVKHSLPGPQAPLLRAPMVPASPPLPLHATYQRPKFIGSNAPHQQYHIAHQQQYQQRAAAAAMAAMGGMSTSTLPPQTPNFNRDSFSDLMRMIPIIGPSHLGSGGTLCNGSGAPNVPVAVVNAMAAAPFGADLLAKKKRRRSRGGESSNEDEGVRELKTSSS
ncbi:hypothetical protein JKP88DRAFT_233459 [Tribonema minus]|uniref:Uncharacterized protein n=1 Tax=Tribonema minus TaxID=303371 RepID=A0A836CMZ1_9STRA|nr:hypothetical protein JKP88DRAFT_233459 [Tribonema minus]